MVWLVVGGFCCCEVVGLWFALHGLFVYCCVYVMDGVRVAFICGVFWALLLRCVCKLDLGLSLRLLAGLVRCLFGVFCGLVVVDCFVVLCFGFEGVL